MCLVCLVVEHLCRWSLFWKRMGLSGCVSTTGSLIGRPGRMPTHFQGLRKDALSGAKWFSTLDLASGYNQIVVAEKDSQKTASVRHLACMISTVCLSAFVTPQGPFSALWSVFLVTSTSSHYCCTSMMWLCSHPLLNLIRFQMVLSRFRGHGLKVKWSKCRFSSMKSPIWVISPHRRGWRQTQVPICAVAERQQPMNFKEL